MEWYRRSRKCISFGIFMISLCFRGAIAEKVTKIARVEGDVMLGALMMVHERENETLECGDVMPQGGIQAVEAMLYTIDYVNRHQIIPHLKLGATIRDDCDKDTKGLREAVHFIKGSMENMDSEYVCRRKDGGAATSQLPTTGVIAAASSVTSIQVANLLKLFKIPQISFFSTSPELSHKDRFPYFFRTIPSDKHQTQAMTDIIKKLEWKYISVLYEESSYGKKALEELERNLDREGICIAVKERFPKDSEVARQEKYNAIVKKLQEKPNAKGVVIYGSDQEVHTFMKAVRMKNATGQFTWIGSDGWSARALVYQGGYEPEVLGTISVQPEANEIAGFKDYFRGLTVENNARDEWFDEFWEKEFECKFPSSPVNNYNNEYKKPCTGREHTDNHTYQFESQLQFVSDAVMAFAFGIKEALEDLCLDYADKKLCFVCAVFKNCSDSTELTGEKLRNVLETVQFRGLAGNNFSFETDQHDPQPNYKIIHFRTDPVTKLPTWKQVGSYTENGLALNISALQFHTQKKKGDPKIPTSICSKECEPHQIKSTTTDCCFVCTDCGGRTEFKVNATHCAKCLNGTLPSENKTICVPIPEDVVQMVSIYGIICMILAIIGFLVNIFILVAFLRHNDTPLVKASGRELCYIILSGLFLCFLVTPIVLLPPHFLSCGFLRVISGFCFVLIYAGILTKTNRIARIFQSGKKTTKRPYMISPKSQLLICSTLCSVQLVLVALWLYAYPPEAINVFPTVLSNLRVCGESVESRFFFTYAYPILLCIVCTYYAFQTRKMPQAFNESKLIGFAVYLTCVIWLAFLPVYQLSLYNTALRVTSMCVATTLNGFVIQGCMFIPKAYIILLKPEKNVRQAVLGSRGSGTGRALFSTTNTNIGLAAGGSAVRDFQSDNSLFSEDEVTLEFASKKIDRSSSIATQTPSPSVEEPLLTRLSDHSLTQTSTSGLLTPAGPYGPVNSIAEDVAL